MGHAHHHHPPPSGQTDRRVLAAAVATGVFTAVELAGGIYANSLALIGDAFHNLTDVLALLLALVAIRLGRRPATPERSFGFQRAGVLAAFVNAGALVAFTIYLLVEAWHRLSKPEAVDSTTMFITAAAALLLNSVLTLLLRDAARHDLSVRSAVVHLVSDAASSAGIIVGALLIRWTGKTIFDPIISILIAVMILWSSWGILRETVNLLLDSTPTGIDPDGVKRDLAAEEGVLGVHHLHIWALAPSRPSLSCHLQLGDVSLKEASAILGRANAMLDARYGIAHTTIQIEYADCVTEDPNCAPAH